MSGPATSITLTEWETASPATHEELSGRVLDNSPAIRNVVATLHGSRKLRFTELRDGLKISAFSHVGRVQLGELDITVRPKLQGSSLLHLLQYAFGFRKLELILESNHLADQCGFFDLLIAQLNAEAHEIISRGLQRAYVRQDERLSSLRGRIDLGRLARDGGTISATLPCQHFPRIEDTVLNRVLMAGLHLAGSVASLLELRRNSMRLALLMDEHVSRITLDSSTLDRAARRLNRLTRAYVPALSIIRLLVDARGVVLEGRTETTRLPGFLFDMNRFFQALISRFLRENLAEYTVRDEQGLKNMMRYHPAFNPRNLTAPTPRPDFAVIREGRLVAILDAKYRDLWERKLPRDMLYQLIVYAISHRDQLGSSILYPTVDPRAQEARIEVADPVYGEYLGQVSLRPVNLRQLEELVMSQTPSARASRVALARRLALGSEA